MVRWQTRQARRFKIFKSAHHFRIESGRPIRIRISKLRRSLDFTGEFMIIRKTSVGVHGQNDASVNDAGTNTGGGGRPSVVERISLTFVAKKLAKSSGECTAAALTSRLQPSSDDSERHRTDELPHCINCCCQ